MVVDKPYNLVMSYQTLAYLWWAILSCIFFISHEKRFAETSGSRGLSPIPSPLRTVRAAFTAHGSSISKGHSFWEDPAVHTFSDHTHFLSGQYVLSVMKVRLPAWIMGVCTTPDLGVSDDSDALRVEQFIALLLTIFLDYCGEYPWLVTVLPVFTDQPTYILITVTSPYPFP